MKRKPMILIIFIIFFSGFLIYPCVLQPHPNIGMLGPMASEKVDFKAPVNIPLPAAHDAMWNKTFGGVDTDQGRSVVECSDGGFAVAGATRSFGLGDWDFWLIRTDNLGNELWAYRYGTDEDEYCYDLVMCSDGGFALAGYTDEPGDDTYWLVRTDQDGNHLWNQTYDYPGNSDFVYDLVLCSDGGFALAGYTHPHTPESSDIWLVRTDADGNHLWNQTYGGTETETASSVVECSDGGFAIAGDIYTSTFEGQAFLVRTDSNGDLIWSRHYGGDSGESAYSLITSSAGGFVLTGYTESYGEGDSDLWLVRIQADGDMVWNRTYGGIYWDDGWDLLESENGDFLITGRTASFGAGNADAWLIRTDHIGNHIWNHTYGGMPNDRGDAVIEYSTGGFAFTGSSRSFDMGSDDLWLVRVPEDVPPTWDETPTDQTISSGVSFRYDLNASDSSGIGAWWLNDTISFVIDAEGVITNRVPLAGITYGLLVRVNDTYGNILQASFSVTVQQTTPPIPGFPIEAIVLGLALILSPIIIYRHKKIQK